MFFAHLVWEEFVRQEFFRSSGRSSEQENRIAIYFNYLAIGGHVVLPHFRQEKHKSPCYRALGLLVAMRLKSNV
jgi:hypothetical protein